MMMSRTKFDEVGLSAPGAGWGLDALIPEILFYTASAGLSAAAKGFVNQKPGKFQLSS
jgi:hypothetical protein